MIYICHLDGTWLLHTKVFPHNLYLATFLVSKPSKMLFTKLGHFLMLQLLSSITEKVVSHKMIIKNDRYGCKHQNIVDFFFIYMGRVMRTDFFQVSIFWWLATRANFRPYRYHLSLLKILLYFLWQHICYSSITTTFILWD